MHMITYDIIYIKESQIGLITQGHLTSSYGTTPTLYMIHYTSVLYKVV